MMPSSKRKKAKVISLQEAKAKRPPKMTQIPIWNDKKVKPIKFERAVRRLQRLREAGKSSTTLPQDGDYEVITIHVDETMTDMMTATWLNANYINDLQQRSDMLAQMCARLEFQVVSMKAHMQHMQHSIDSLEAMLTTMSMNYSKALRENKRLLRQLRGKDKK